MVVSHQGSAYLPRTLAALSRQSRAADVCIGVDAASSDGSARLLEEALGSDSVTLFRHPRLGFGAAVQAGLATADRLSSGDAATLPTDQQWVWLLHDDSAPAPDALERLLEAVERSSNVTIAGAKQLDWNSQRKLVDAGLAVSTWAERLTLIEADELDQGQYDQLRDRFAVNSAGMLVRRDVWDAMGGFDPALPGTGDDVDLCWRNWLAGNNVAFVPQARMYHVQNRPHALGTPAAARTSQVYLRLKHTSWWKIPFLVLGTLIASVGRFLLAVAMKDPGYGFQQLAGTIRGVSRPVALARGRKVAARTRKNPRKTIRRLQTSREEVWAHRRSLMEALGADELLDASFSSTGLASEPSGDNQDDFSALAAPSRAFAGWGLIAAVLITAGIALAGLFPVLGGTQSGGGLLPLSATLGEVWDNATRSWVTLEAGYPGHGDPFGLVLWILSVLNGGQPALVVQSVLLGAMPLAAAGAWFLAAALTRHRRAWFLAALIWGTAPALFTSLNQGRLGAILVHLLTPWLALALVRATGSARDRRLEAQADGLLPPGPLTSRAGVGGAISWTAAAWAGLLLAAVTASAPVLLVPSLVSVALLALLLRRRGRALWWSLTPPLALFLPFAFTAVTQPRAFLADPGVPLAFGAAPLWEQLLGQPIAVDLHAAIPGLGWLPGDVPWAFVLMLVLAAPVLLFAVWGALVPGRRGRTGTLALLIAAVFLAVGWAVPGIAVAVGVDAVVTPFTGPAVSVATCAVLVSAILGADRALQRRKASRSRRAPWRVAVVSVAVVVLLLGPALSSWTWLASNLGVGTPADGPRYGAAKLFQTQDKPQIPATAVDRGRGPEQTRTLVITELGDGSYTAALARGSGTTLDALSTLAAVHGIRNDSAAPAADDDASAGIRSAVATIVAGQGVDPRPTLEKLGAGFVVLKGANDAAGLTASRIDAVPGLAAVGPTDAGWLWRVRALDQPPLKDSDTINRVRVVDGSGKVQSQLPSGTVGVDTTLGSGAEGRKLVLAERSDPNWTASLDGKRLNPTTVGWQQAFDLPASGGHLVVAHSDPWIPWVRVITWVVFIVTALLAVPIPERPGKVRMVRDEASLRKAGHD